MKMMIVLTTTILQPSKAASHCGTKSIFKWFMNRELEYGPRVFYYPYGPQSYKDYSYEERLILQPLFGLFQQAAKEVNQIMGDELILLVPYGDNFCNIDDLLNTVCISDDNELLKKYPAFAGKRLAGVASADGYDGQEVILNWFMDESILDQSFYGEMNTYDIILNLDHLKRLVSYYRNGVDRRDYRIIYFIMKQVIMHEMLHTIGFDHTNEDQTLMVEAFIPWKVSIEDRDDLTDSEFEEFLEKYFTYKMSKKQIENWKCWAQGKRVEPKGEAYEQYRDMQEDGIPIELSPMPIPGRGEHLPPLRPEDMIFID